MIQLHSEVSCIFENLHMKSTSWIGTDGKESLAPNCAAYGGSFLTAYTYIYIQCSAFKQSEQSNLQNEIVPFVFFGIRAKFFWTETTCTF